MFDAKHLGFMHGKFTYITLDAAIVLLVLYYGSYCIKH